MNHKTNQVFHESLIPALVEGLGATSYLEVGVYDGMTIGAVKQRCRKCRCVGVDHKAPPRPIRGVEMLVMDVDRFWAQCKDTFDVIFIDCDHSAESVRKDYEHALKHCAKDGLILLHDTNPLTQREAQPGYCNDCWVVARELVSQGVEAVTLPYTPGLTIIRNRVQWGPR